MLTDVTLSTQPLFFGMLVNDKRDVNQKLFPCVMLALSPEDEFY